MILANVFCLLFFLGEYLWAGRAASPPEPGGPRGTARSVAGEEPGTRGASGARAGDRRGERAAERAGPRRCRTQRGRAARLRAEGREPRLAGYAGGSGRRLGTPRPSPHTRTHAHTHTRLLTHNASTHFSQNNGFKLRQLKKKESQLLIWKRGGWGEALCRGEKNHASSIFLVGSRIDSGGRHGFLLDLLIGHRWGQRCQPSPHLPINLWEMHPSSRSRTPF